MIITEEKYCIVSKSFPLKFYYNGNEEYTFSDYLLMSKESCEDELSTYDEPEDFNILKVNVTYEF